MVRVGVHLAACARKASLRVRGGETSCIFLPTAVLISRTPGHGEGQREEGETEKGEHRKMVGEQEDSFA